MCSHRDGGYTLVEMILVIVIVSILLGVSVPKFINLVDTKVESSRCASARGAINSALSVTYAAVLIHDPTQEHWLSNATLSNLNDSMFATGHIPVCSRHGIITIVDGQAVCSIHGH